MYYIVYDRDLPINKRLYIYNSEDGLNHDWLNEFKKYCAINNTAPFESKARYKLIPLDEDNVSIEPLEVKSFSNWKIIKCKDMDRLLVNLTDILKKNHLKDFICKLELP